MGGGDDVDGGDDETNFGNGVFEALEDGDGFARAAGHPQ